jgi:hypothetical protein
MILRADEGLNGGIGDLGCEERAVEGNVVRGESERGERWATGGLEWNPGRACERRTGMNCDRGTETVRVPLSYLGYILMNCGLLLAVGLSGVDSSIKRQGGCCHRLALLFT